MALPTFESATSRVYTAYDIADPPPHPGPAWTRFVCISDTHSRIYKVPPGDVLLHSGDLSSWGSPKQLEKTLKWLNSLPHPTKIVIAGNHDLCLDIEWIEGGTMGTQEYTQSLDLIKRYGKRIKYLEYESHRFTTKRGRTWEVYGSPAVPRYVPGSFQYEGTIAAQAIYSRIPPSTEILLTHTPPHGICDETKRHKRAGCPVLTKRLANEDLNCIRLHVFGHIHEAYGAYVTPPEVPNERVSVNAALPNSDCAIIVDLLN
ncbi:Metallo-dependent phosphatase [Irpex rosettiformis]|uniref:Metallo-dependent phosphatase n=1 Tax=Irpex rosettiformis TaxID=378272 RepID=A0ACB8TWJ9_9APHY|nr:Metallo-dependent phosphatase [Irpex rosettiformis]